MKHAFRKIGAVLLAAILTLAMAVPAFAADTFTINTAGTGTTRNEKNTITNGANVSVSGLPDEAQSVSFYQAVYATKEGENVVQYRLTDWAWKAVKDLKDDKGEALYADEAAALKALGVTTNEAGQQTINPTKTDPASAILSTLSAYAQDENNSVPVKTTVTDIKSNTATYVNAPVGSYVVVVNNREAKTGETLATYNPMMVSVGLTAENDLYNGVKATGGVAKFSTETFDKKIVSKDGGEQANKDTPDTTYTEQKDANGIFTNGNAKGGDLGVGDTVTYQVTGAIPNFNPNEYTDPWYEISDKLDTSLDYNHDIIVKIGTGDTAVVYSDAKDSTHKLAELGTFTDNATKDYTWDLQFSDTFINANKDKAVTIQYSAKLNQNAKTGFDANTNTATLKYGHNPNTAGGEKPTEVHKTTYDYSFAVDGGILGNGENKIETWEMKKTGEGEWTKTKTGEDTIKSDYAALSGAVFTIYTKDKDNKLVEYTGTKSGSATFTTGGNGRITFEGLDADTVYYIKETTAPTGYSLNTQVYAVKFEAAYNSDGTLKKYTANVYKDDATDANKLYSITYAPNEDDIVYTVDENGVKHASLAENATTIPTTYTTQPKSTITTTETIDTTEIRNTKTSSLPATGGMGTYIFTIGGVALIAFAAVMLVARRKRS